MDTDGGPQADDGGEQVLIIRTSFILSGAHQATQVPDCWLLIIDYWWLMITDDWLFAHYLFSAVLIKLRKFLIGDDWWAMSRDQGAD